MLSAYAGKVQRALAGQLGEPGDEPLVDRVELVGARRQLAGRELILQPEPLEGGGFIERRRRVGVVFEQLGGARPV